MDKVKIPNYSFKEELINSISHGIGVILSIIGLILIKGNNNFIMFCLTLILLYLISTIYHALPKTTLKKLFRVADHLCVFILEAGTFTPVCLVMIKGKVGIIYLSFIWLITLVFIVLNIASVDKYNKVSLLFHLIMGWSVLFFYKTIINNTNTSTLLLLIIGGLVYSIGAIFYKLGNNIRYMHSLFHFFCLFGSLIHYLMLYNLK